MSVAIETPPAPPRARILPRTISLAAVLVTAVAFGAAGTLAVRADTQERDVRLNAALDIRAEAAAALVYFDNGTLVTDDLQADEVGTGTPQVVVLKGTPAREEVFATADPAVTLPYGDLTRVADAAVAAEEATGGRSGDRPLLATPFFADSGAVAGAVIVVGDPEADARQHRRVLIGFLLAGLGALLVVWAATYLLVRRALYDPRQ
jgi:two-component system, OmpR family, sensor kinase